MECFYDRPDESIPEEANENGTGGDGVKQMIILWGKDPQGR